VRQNSQRYSPPGLLGKSRISPVFFFAATTEIEAKEEKVMKIMQAILMGSALFLLAIASTPANAQDGRELHWNCERGDHNACRILRLHRECEEGNHHACEELRFDRKD
jgi:hypothetical protein